MHIFVVILLKLSNLFDPLVVAKNTAFKPPVVLINANEALASYSLLNSEPLSHVLIELSLKIEIIMRAVFSQITVPMIVAFIELALEMRILL